MPTSASELFIVDNSDSEWKVRNYLTDWCELSKTIDIATGYFEIGALLALKDKWQQVDSIRLLMGDEVSKRTKRAFEEGLKKIATTLDASLESEKKANDFLSGVPAVVEPLRSGKIQCRVYRKDKFHAKCYLTHGRQAVIGSFGLVGSSNFTGPGLQDNVELNVQIRGNDVKHLQEWYERHWDESEDITAEVLRTFERHTNPRTPFEVWFKALHELLRDLELVVQRSRVYVKKSESGCAGGAVVFPTREVPRVAPYKLKVTYGRLLESVEQVLSRTKPLFGLPLLGRAARGNWDDFDRIMSPVPDAP